MKVKIKISPAQSLLLMIEYYKTLPSDKVTRKTNDSLLTLCKMYSDGMTNPTDRRFFERYLDCFKDSVLEPYDVFSYKLIDEAIDNELINNDPTRRYFETHLAFESIKKNIKSYSSTNIELMCNVLKDIIKTKDEDKYSLICAILNPNEIPLSHENAKSYKEYSDYFSRIKKNIIFTDSQGFNTEDRDKISHILTFTFLSLIFAGSSLKSDIPLNIYGTAQFFLEGARGRMLKERHELLSVHSNQNYGLMKAHMYLPKNDIALSSSKFSFIKPSEQSNFLKEAYWVKDNFSYLVHPFSNSISGTTLCVLRAICFFNNNKNLISTYDNAATLLIIDSQQQFDSYLNLFSSLMVYFSGGHSFHEIFAVLRLTEVKNQFEKYKVPFSLDSAFTSRFFLKDKDINSRSDIKNKCGKIQVRVFDSAFEQALEDTFIYNKQHLIKKQIFEHLKEEVRLRKEDNSIIKKSAKELDEENKLEIASEEIGNKDVSIIGAEYKSLLSKKRSIEREEEPAHIKEIKFE